MKKSVCWTSEFRSLARRHTDRAAVYDAEGQIAYGALMDRAAGVTKIVRDLPGFRAGTPVATYLPNGRAAVWASLGITMAGAAETAINPHLSEADVAHALLTSGAGVLLTTAERAQTMSAIAEVVPGILTLDAAALPAGAIEALPDFEIDSDCWGKILFTSGTTGRPKGIVHSHGGRWLANLMLRASLPVAPEPDLDVLLLTPFSHGASLMTYAYFEGGASVTLLDRVDPVDVLARLRQGRSTQLFAPPTLLVRLMTEFSGAPIEGVRTIFTGTAPLSREIYSRVRDIFGPVVRITYGKTEMFNPITVLTPPETDGWFADPDLSTTCVGWPVSGVDIRIEQEAETPSFGEGAQVAGPILLRSPHQLAGTLMDGVFTPQPKDAYHRSGDIGFLDERGRLHFCGRESDIMKSGGYRISPEEVEAALRPTLPKTDFVVLGLPSEHWGEIVTAVAATSIEEWGAQLTDAIMRMTGYKRPRVFARLDELPRNAMGKVLRTEVRRQVLELYEFEDGRYPSLIRRK